MRPLHPRPLDAPRDDESNPLHWGIGLLEETYDAIVVWDLGGTVRLWNRGAEELFGVPRADALGRAVHELRGTRPPGGTLADLEGALLREGRWEGRLEHAGRAGAIVTDSRLVLATRPEGMRYVVEADRDVTRQHLAEEALRQGQVRTAAILDTALDAIVSMDAGGRITGFNAAAERIFGWRRDEVLGREMAETIVPPHLRDAHRHGLARYLLTGEAHLLGRRIEIEAVRRDGSVFPAELAIVQLPGLEPPTFTGFLRDIGERRRQEAELRRANDELEARAAEERALRTVAERLTGAAHVPEVMQHIAAGALVVAGAMGAYVERVVSRDGEVEVIGVAGEGVPRTGTRVPYPGSLTEEMLERHEPVILTQLVGIGRAMAPYLAERCAGCHVLVIPLLADGAALGALVVLRRGSETPFEFGVVNRARTLGDLASLALQRVMVLQEAERRRDEAEAAVRSRDEVLSVVSHDLRNPVSTIAMSASLLEDEEIRLTEAQQRQQLAVIRRSAQRANRLIQDLLDAGRIAGGRFTIRCHPEQPAALAREACDAFRPVLADREQTLACDIDDALPAVAADRDRVLQVLSNFLNNASKFTPAGGRIALRAWAEDGEVRFAVSDGGPGIAPEDMPNLFRQFWQAKRTAHLGAGLGLTIARGIAEAHGGRVWAESEPGRGATFVLALKGQ